MRGIQLTIFVLLAYTFTGCVSPATSGVPALTGIANQEIIPGQHYEIETIGENPDSKTSYIGKVESLNRDSVVFIDPIQQVKVTQSPRIPIVGRMFKNVGIGRENLNGAVTVNRDKIIGIRQVNQSLNTRPFE